MVPICESLTHSAAACSRNDFQFDMNPNVTHDADIFHHIVLFTALSAQWKGSVK